MSNKTVRPVGCSVQPQVFISITKTVSYMRTHIWWPWSEISISKGINTHSLSHFQMSWFGRFKSVCHHWTSKKLIDRQRERKPTIGRTENMVIHRWLYIVVISVSPNRQHTNPHNLNDFTHNFCPSLLEQITMPYSYFVSPPSTYKTPQYEWFNLKLTGQHFYNKL